MVSYLGSYPGSRAGADHKFIRAVNSFLDQDLKESELIIVSDGCDATEKLYRANFKEEPHIKFFMQPKATGWPGEHRQFAINLATYDWITYLDSDDILTPTRLSKLTEDLPHRGILLDSTYTVPIDSLARFRMYRKIRDFSYADLMWTEYSPAHNNHGTHQLCHHRDTLGVRWESRLTRGEDSQFIRRLIEAHRKQIGSELSNTSIVNKPVGGYLVCHHPTWKFDV